MDDLGAPVAYLALPAGVPVYDRDDVRVGTVEHVFADEGADIFHGILVRTSGSGYRFADREQVAELYERGVHLAVPAAGLHEPNEDAVAAAATDVPLREGLRRAWEWLRR